MVLQTWYTEKGFKRTENFERSVIMLLLFFMCLDAFLFFFSFFVCVVFIHRYAFADFWVLFL